MDGEDDQDEADDRDNDDSTIKIGLGSQRPDSGLGFRPRKPQAPPGAIEQKLAKMDPERVAWILNLWGERSGRGKPTLQKKIAAVNGVPIDWVPLKTLQLFLANPQEGAGYPYYLKFAESLPDEPDPDWALAQGLRSFFPSKSRPPKFSGTFTISGIPSDLVRLVGGASFSSLLYVKPLTRHVWRVRETVKPPGTGSHVRYGGLIAPNKPEADVNIRYNYEGILFHTGDRFIGFLKDSLSGKSRFYFFGISPSAIEGRILSEQFRDNVSYKWNSYAVRVRDYVGTDLESLLSRYRKKWRAENRLKTIKPEPK